MCYRVNCIITWNIVISLAATLEQQETLNLASLVLIKASQPSPNQSEIQILITQSKVQVNWTIQVLQRSAQLEKDSKVYKEWEYELWEHYQPTDDNI